MSKRPLAPRFINQLDDYLLKNRPDTWSTRVHLVLYYWLIFAIGLSAICFVIPDNPLSDSDIEFWTMSTSVLVIVGIVLWIVYLVRFNAFKSYGTVYPGDRIKTYFFFFLTLLVLSATMWIPPLIETYKTRILYSPSKVTEDMNRMNLLLAKLNKSSAPAEITVDSIFIIDYSTYVPSPSSGAYDWDDSLGAYVKAPIYVAREELKWTLTPQDSVVWISNDKLLRFTVTDLHFISNYEIEEDASVHPLTNFEIYNAVYKNTSPQDVQKLEREYFAIAENYFAPHADEWNDYWLYSGDMSSVDPKYQVGRVNAGIRNICERLYRYDEEVLVISFHVMYYIGMFLGLCLFIFRHSTMRTFFLSILTAVLLAILTGIFAAFLDFDEEGVLITALVYFVFFMIFSLATIQAKVRSVFTGIALNLAVLCTPFIPLLSVLLYYRFHQFDYMDGVYYDYSTDLYQQHHDTEILHYQISEIFGFIILLVMIETVYKWMYRKWYAAPEE